MTCCPEAKSDPSKRAGVCLACSLMCHESHELVELYTKRNFRCDCGSPKFNSHPCTFTPNKADLNEENYYNQNFSGLYCICQRPYPDPDTTEEDVMIQCIVCEDWLHGSHLDATVPNNDQYSEMICKTCMEKNAFLHDYSELAVNIENVDVDVVNGVDNSSKLSNGDAKTESDNSLNESVSKTDVEMTDEKLEANVNATELSSESKDGNPPLDSKSGSDIEEKISSQDANKEESMETNQLKPSDAASEESPESGVPKQSIEKSEEAVTGSEIKDDANDVPEEPVVNKTENNSDKITEENITDQSENKADEEQTKEEIYHPVDKPSEENATKIEEDRLLADPEDDPTATEQATTTNETNNLSNDTKITNDSNITSDTVSHEKEEQKLDTSVDSGVDEKLNTSDENVNSEEAPSKSVEQNANDVGTNAKDTSTNNDVNTDDSSENKIESESIPDKNTPECDTAQSSAEKVTEKRKHVDENSDNIDAKKQKLDSVVCVRPKGVKKVYKGATFWPSNFRQTLCTCQECISMYKDLSVLFLIDPEDTVSAYENLGKQNVSGRPTQYERGMQALSSLDRIQQINALTEYNKMRDKLLDFLKSFKDKKEIVKEEDIKAFFAGMKPKRKPDGVYFCR